MEGIITVKTKGGTVLKANIWEMIDLLCYQSRYVFLHDITEIGIDGFGVPKPESMEDET